MAPNTVRIGNIDIDSFALDDFLQTLRKGGIVFTPNVDHLMKLQHDLDFYQAYQSADYRVCDSQVLFWFSHIIGNPIKQKITGSDLLPAFCRYFCDDDEISIFFLGAAPGVAEQAAQNINQRLGRKMVTATHSPSYGFEKDEAECLDVVKKINRSKATVLAVGVGAPKQEKWIIKYSPLLKHAKIILAVGATLDFEADLIRRAPLWISELGLEWLYRLSREPQRLFRRYLLEDVFFLGLMVQQILGIYQYPAFMKDSMLDDSSTAMSSRGVAMPKQNNRRASAQAMSTATLK